MSYSSGQSPHELMELRERYEMLHRLIQDDDFFTSDEVVVLRGRYFDGLTQQECATRIGASVGTARAAEYRAIWKIRNLMRTSVAVESILS